MMRPVAVSLASPGVVLVRRGRVECRVAVFRPRVTSFEYRVDGERRLTEVLPDRVNCLERAMDRMRFLEGVGKDEG